MLVVGILAVLSLFAAACGSDDGDDGGATGGGSGDASDCPVDALDSAEAPVEIEVWHAILGLAAQTVEEFAQDYNASQDKVRVTVESQGANYEEQQTKFEAALRDPDTLPDVMLAEDTNTRFMIDSQAAIPAQACIEADPEAGEVYDQLLPAVSAGYSVQDVQWPASFGVSTPVLYYNKAHFTDAGLDPENPPSNLAEIRSAAEAIAAAKASGAITAPEGPPFVYRADAWWLENLATGAGDVLVNEDNGRSGLATESELLNESTSEWMAWMQGMTDAGLQKTVAYSATFDAYLAVATQSSSMLIETSTASTTVDALITGSLNAEDLGLEAGADLSGLSFPDLEVGVAQLPGFTDPGSGQIGGNAWYIIGAGKSPEQIAAAWDFLKWVNQTDQQVKWTLQGSYLPVFSSAAESPEMQAFFTDTRPGGWLETAFESLQAVDPEFPGPVIGPYKQFRTALRTAIEDTLIAGKPYDQAFESANADLQQALDAYALDVDQGG